MINQATVSLDLPGRGGRGHDVVHVGTAYFHHRHNLVTTTFRYDASYLARPEAYAIDPSLPLLASGRAPAAMPGAFSDSSPDRWGRNLIRKHLRARSDPQTVMRTVTEVDYLLGVSDSTRQGALRFSVEPGGPFLGRSHEVPKLVALPELLAAADEVVRDPDDRTALKRLLDAGSGSLGGARPKASIADGERLLIAKFPHADDEWDVMAWEMTALDLAERASIQTPARRLTRVAGRSVLLLDRFDRRGGARVGYLSAMSLVGGRDGDSSDYLEIAEALTEYGASTSRDLQQLWRRIAFSIAVHNTDDHLRNHGFLREGSGWVLSPMFDVNPDPDPAADRVTTIAGTAHPDEELEALLTCAPDFRVDAAAARRILREVLSAVSGWRSVAERHGVPAAQITRFGPALERGRAALEAVDA